MPKREMWRAQRLTYEFVSKCPRIVGERSHIDENSSHTAYKCSLTPLECSRTTSGNPLIGHRHTRIGHRKAHIATGKSLIADRTVVLATYCFLSSDKKLRMSSRVERVARARSEGPAF